MGTTDSLPSLLYLLYRGSWSRRSRWGVGWCRGDKSSTSPLLFLPVPAEDKAADGTTDSDSHAYDGQRKVPRLEASVTRGSVWVGAIIQTKRVHASKICTVVLRGNTSALAAVPSIVVTRGDVVVLIAEAITNER